MDLDAFFTDQFTAHADTVTATHAAVGSAFGALVAACAGAVRAGGKIIFFGNGGSAADAQHLATELTVRYVDDRAPIAALALTTDTSTLTAAGNDFGFDQIFSRQIEALATPGDACIGISTSGNSENVLLALHAAKTKGAVAAGFTGRDGGKMVGLADPLIVVPSRDTARIQEMHILLGHMLCGALEKELGLL